MEVHRVWERRSTAIDGVGDSLFTVFARDFAPLAERLVSLTGRLEARARLSGAAQDAGHGAPGPALAGAGDRVRRATCRAFFDEIKAAGHGRAGRARAGPAGQGRRDGFGGRRRATSTGSRRGHGLDRRILGPGLRGAGPADRAARLRRPGCRPDPGDRAAAAGAQQGRPSRGRPTHRPNASETRGRGAGQVEPPGRLRGGAGGLQGRHDASPGPHHRARHRHASRPTRRSPSSPRRTTCARSSPSPPTSSRPSSTPGRWASTSSRRRSGTTRTRCASTTSPRSATPASTRPTQATISQLSVAMRHPSLVRLLTDAPEFVEGWGMYSEQMMREQGFDDGPEFLLAMHTDAIWRACRIILDIRMHRGELTVDRGDRLPRRAHRLRARQRPGRGLPLHVHAHLPAQLPAGQGAAAAAPGRRAAPPGRPLQPEGLPRRAAAQRQPADQLPAPAAGGRGASGRACWSVPSIDVSNGRSRLVYWPGVADRRRHAHRPSGADRPALRGHGRHDDPYRRHGRRPGRATGQSRGRRPR